MERPTHLDESYIYCYKGEHWVVKDIEIYKNRASNRGYATSCKECDRAPLRDRQRDYRRRERDWVNEQKNKPCDNCNILWPPFVMDFDHRPGEIKLFAISQSHRKVKDRAKVQAEIDKCDLLCSNCHRIRHFEDGTIGENQYS